MTNKIFTINIDKIKTYADESEALVPSDTPSDGLAQEAESSLVALLEIETQVKEAIAAVKYKIKADGIKRFGDNFKGIKGSKLTVGYQFVGGQPEFVPEKEIESVREDFLNTSIKLNGDAIRKYRKEHDELPPAIVENTERSKAIVIRKNKVKDE